jgi:predicted phosphodiesterase
MTKANIAREYRAKHPEMPSAKLARIMKRDLPTEFPDLEQARWILRYIENKGGPKDARGVKSDKGLLLTPRPMNPYNLPKSDEAEYKPFVFKGHKRVLIMADIHVPYHNIGAITAAIRFGKAEKPDALLLNGDTLDFYRISRFQSDFRKRSIAEELQVFKDLIDVFKKELKCKIYFKLGNHDERYEQFLMRTAHELIGVEEFEFANIIKARAEGITIIGDKRVMHLNKLRGIHGHEYIGGITAPVNIARGLYLRGKVSAFQGHNHTTSEHTEPNMDSDITTTWSLGCLCELHPQYMPLNKWNHGFGIVDLDSNGRDFEFRNKRIKDGKIL